MNSQTPATPAPRLAVWRDLLVGGRGPALALVLLGCWVVAADSLVTATIMPSVGAALDGYAWFGWAGSGFMTGLVVAGASAGWLAERIGLRAAMILSGITFALGCVMSAAAPGIALFLAGRVVQGAAAGWIGGLIYVAMALLFPGRHLPRVFALCTAIWGIATLAGPLLGGVFADAGFWRGIFWLFATQAVLFAAASWFLVPPPTDHRTDSKLPLSTMALVALGIGAVATAGVTGGLMIPASLLAGGVVLLAAAFAIDRSSDNALLPRRSSAFPLGVAYLTYFATTAAGTAFALYAPAMLQISAKLSALEAGYVVAIEALAWTLVSLSVSGASARWQPRLIIFGTAAILAGNIGIPLSMDRESLFATGVFAAFLGGGFGMSYAFLGQQVIGSFDDASRTRGSAAIGTARNAGGAIGAAIAGVGANAADFGEGLAIANLPAVAWRAIGIGIPFAVAGLIGAIRLARPATPVPAPA